MPTYLTHFFPVMQRTMVVSFNGKNPSQLRFQKACMLWRQAEAVVACSEQQNHAPMPPLLYSTLPLNTLLRGNGLSLALVFLVAVVVVVVVVLSAGRESCMAEKENGVVAMACMVKKEEFTLEKD